MSERFTSTAVSDFVLAGCSFFSGLNVHKSSYAAWGFCVVGAAASLGVLRFGVVFPRLQSNVIRFHVLLTWLASVVGIPLVAAGFCIYHHKPTNATFHLVSSVIAVFLSLIHTPMEKTLTKVVSSMAIFGIAFVTYMSVNFYATFGALAYGAAAAIEPVNSFLGLRGVDWFHYILAVANLLLMYGLMK